MKKIFGVLLILLAAFFSLMLFALFINIVLNNDAKKISEDNAAHNIGYLIGSFLFFGLLIAINFVLYFFGIKLLKSKKKELIAIPDEDFPSQLGV